MGLGRIQNGRDCNSKESMRIGDKWKIDFILQNKNLLAKRRNGNEKIQFIAEMRLIVNSQNYLTPKQSSYVDSIYEMVWSEYDKSQSGNNKLGSFSATYKPPKNRLRYK